MKQDLMEPAYTSGYKDTNGRIWEKKSDAIESNISESLRKASFELLKKSSVIKSKINMTESALLIKLFISANPELTRAILGDEQ